MWDASLADVEVFKRCAILRGVELDARRHRVLVIVAACRNPYTRRKHNSNYRINAGHFNGLVRGIPLAPPSLNLPQALKGER